MTERTMSARKTLTALLNEYNEYASAAAYLLACDHDAYRTSAVASTALLEVVSKLFRSGKDYKLTMTPASVGGVEFEWRKMEVAK